ncbi:hypothetical protein AA106_16820 [Photorhabdus laumondii subsp. laumondii]|uniref:hypothetical protein n=1 Tax=Photorhabdus laumondii TaxID=2218628 RepID=UPI0007336ABC|nr:hypothetical protein [Photorhabdus laumondii]KTL59538.1 hypothetical protein AA106_16820 [Photorhabdus laumondii subsp. laumondii]
MNNQDALFPIVKDDIAFETLLTQAKMVIEQQSGQLWSNTEENDPGITLLEACCYGASDLAYRHSLPLRDLLTPEKQEQTLGDGIFPQEFGPQQMLTCGPITAEDYRRALLDLHLLDWCNNDDERIKKIKRIYQIEKTDKIKTEDYFFFNDIQLIREPENERYQYWYNKESREYSFIQEQEQDQERLTLRGNYWLYLLPSRKTQIDNKLAQEKLNDFLNDNRNLGESVSKIIWLQPVDFLLQLDIELDDDVSDVADIFAQIYMTTEQMVLTSPLRYSTQAMIEQGYSNEEIFEGPYLHHGWIPELPAAKDYIKPTELRLSHLANRLLAIPGVQSITRLALGEHDENISPLADDSWSWTIAQGYYPRLWGNDPLDLISSSASPLTITAKGGVKVTVSKQDIENKIIAEPLIETQPELLNWGKHRKVLDYYPVSNKLPACYGLQTYAETQQQVHLHQFMLPFEQLLANGCAELNLLPKLLAFKQRGNNVYGTQWPFKENTTNQEVYKNIKTNLTNQLDKDSKIYINDDIQQQNYDKELTILDYLLGYFGAKCAIPPLLPNSLTPLQDKDFLFTQRKYLAQQPELTYQRNNIRIDKVSALQKRIAARLGLGGKCFEETPKLDELPFYLIEHRQLLPIKPDPQFDEEQTPDNLEIKDETDTKNHQLIITQTGKANQLLQGQIIDLIITEGDGENKKVLRNQMITNIEKDTFTLNTSNSSDLERNWERVEKAFNQGNLHWKNSSVWLEDMDYQLAYAPKEHEENERWITVNSQTPFPAMIEVDDEITIKYVITPSKPGSKTLYQADELEYELKVKVVEFDYFENIILVKKEEYSPHNFPLEAEASNYHWYFSNGSILSDRFSFIVSVVLNRQLIEENNNTDPYKLDSWIKSEILAEFPVHLSLIIHWLSPEHFKDFSSTYQRWQNNGAPLGDEAYHVLETLTLGRLPSAATGIGNMRIATAQQRIDVVGESGKEWNTEVIISNQLVYVPYTGENLNKR